MNSYKDLAKNYAGGISGLNNAYQPNYTAGVCYYSAPTGSQTFNASTLGGNL